VALGAVTLFVAGSAAQATSAPVTTARTASSVAAASPISALPAGPAPVGVPYGIGKRIYLNGVASDLSGRWTVLAGLGNRPFSEFHHVTISRGVVVFSIGLDQIDPAEVVGALPRGGSAIRIDESPSFELAVTSGGLVTTGTASTFQATVPVVTTAGRSYPPPFVDPLVADPYYAVSSQGAGGSFVYQAVDPSSFQTQQSYRQYPGYAAARLPYDNTLGVGAGWLATFDSIRSSCFRVAALSTPATVRAHICSQTTPVVSPDGTKVVVVQGNHVRLYATGTGAQVNATNAPTLATRTVNSPANGYFPFAWESASAYLVYAKDGNALYILRCSTGGACQRAVTSSVRTGVSHISVMGQPY
jgi:hypothetical protein